MHLSLKNSLGRLKILLDSDVQAFKEDSGATDLFGLNALTKYLKGEGLYNNSVIYPMKSAQNAGSGSTVYGLGGLTTNDMTLVNSPTWGSTGITYNGTNQYGLINDFLGSEEIFVFLRLSLSTATPTTVQSMASQYNATSDNRGWIFNHQGNVTNDPYRLIYSPDGSSATAYEDGGNNASTNDQTLIGNWKNDSSTPEMWINKSGNALTLATGTPSARFNSTAPILVAAVDSNSPTNFTDALYTSAMFVNTALTATQRESITDLINAL